MITTTTRPCFLKIALLCGLVMTASCAPRSYEPVYIRVNNVGYLEEDTKVAIAFSHSPVDGEFELVDARSGDVVMSGPVAVSPAEGWGAFEHYYELDFSSAVTTGRYVVQVGGDRSPEFGIGREAYGRTHEDLLTFMRQQRCGYNPYLDRYCHQKDGRTFYGPMPDSTFVDARGEAESTSPTSHSSWVDRRRKLS